MFGEDTRLSLFLILSAPWNADLAMTPAWKPYTTLLIICLVSGCARTQPAPVVSPDGSMEAVPDIPGELSIAIKGKDGSVLYRWHTGASQYQWWTVEWKDNRTLLMESGDIGAYTLERLPDNTWRESTPGGVFSPDGTLKVQTSWESRESKKLKLWIGEVRGHRSYSIHGEFQTDLVTLDPFDCARWDGNNRVIVKTLDGEHSWIRMPDGAWAREN